MKTDSRPASAGLQMDRLAAAVVRTVREPLLVLDGELRVLTANAAFYQTFRSEPGETVGRVLWELGRHQWDIPSLRERLTGILQGGSPVVDYQVEAEFEGLGERIMFVNARRIQREDGDLILVAVDDVTEEVRARRERETLIARLEESNRELERFAHVASHDLQEPLRMISSYTELLERRYRDALDERARKYIDYAADGARRMQSMISGLLEYSRVAQLEDEPGVVDLNEILATVRRDLSVALEEEGGTLEVASLPLVRGDPDRLAQVFRNLIANAIKFRGEVDPEIRVTAEDCGGTWRVGVHDNGIGIEPEYFDQIFVVFKRLNSRREYAGAGVGLALCRKIVEHHGGRMEVESRPGEGSSFYLTLPGVEPA